MINALTHLETPSYAWDEMSLDDRLTPALFNFLKANCQRDVSLRDTVFAKTLLAALKGVKSPESYTAAEIVIHLLTDIAIRFRYYRFQDVWQSDAETHLKHMSVVTALDLFSHKHPFIYSYDNLKSYYAGGDFTPLTPYIGIYGLKVVNCLWYYDFSHIAYKINVYHNTVAQGKIILPFKDTRRLATITRKGYVGMLNGNSNARRMLAALDQEFMGALQVYNYRPLWRDSQNPVLLQELKQNACTVFDTELLQVIYTELLMLYKRSEPEQREAYKRGEPVLFSGKKLLRKMTQYRKTYNLHEKLLQYDNLYSIKVLDEFSDKIGIAKMLTVESFTDDLIQINAATVMDVIAELEDDGVRETRKYTRPPGYAFFLPVGGKKTSGHAKIIAEHIIATIKQAGLPFNGQAKRININLWKIMVQYPQIVDSYEGHSLTRNKNRWLQRVVESLYKLLYVHVAPNYREFCIYPEIVNRRTQKAVNLPTSSTLKNHKMYVTHKGKIQQ